MMAKYDALRVHLSADGRPRIDLSFEAISKMVGGLPKSAYEYPAWWSNEETPGSHVNAHAWFEAGYRVDQVDWDREHVRFVRR